MRLTGGRESAFEVVLAKAAPVLAAGGELKSTLSEDDVRCLVQEGRALVNRLDLLAETLLYVKAAVVKLECEL